MGIAIAIGITLLVLGSILWVKPSPRDAAITKMRSQALASGLKVRLLDEKLASNLFPWVDNYRLYTLYETMLDNKEKPASPKPIVVRLKYPENAHELDRRDEWHDKLSERGALQNVPETAEALIISVSGLSILWVEDYKNGEEQVRAASDFLNVCRQHAELWR